MPPSDTRPPLPGLSPEMWQHVFHVAQVPMFIEDIGAARELVQQAAAKVGPDRFGAWLDAHPEFVGRIVAATRVLDANEAAVRLNAAASREELLVSLDKLILPESLPGFKRLITLLAEGAAVYEGECQYRALDGREYYTMNRAWLPPAGDPRQVMVIATLDITDRKLAERALAVSEERYRQLIETAKDVILRHDLAGRITFVNQAGVDLLGRPREQLLGLPLAELVAAREDPGDRPRSGGMELYETGFRRRDGSVIPVEVNATPVQGTPGLVDEPQMLLVARDISARRALEAERDRIQARLREAQRLESLGVLAGGIAHDFNNLLAVILGNAELVPDGDPETRAGLAAIREAGRRAAELCNEMLAFSGAGASEPEACDLSRAVEEIRGLLGASLTGGSHLGFDLGDGLPPARVEASQVQQVVMNLVANAAEALGGQGGEIVVRTGAGAIPEADAGTWRLGNPAPGAEWLFCEVRDSGEGMAPETMGRACDPFFSTRAEGRGLGLFAVAGIIRTCGGALDIDSAPARGTAVTLWLPRGPDAARAARAAAPDRSALDLTGRTILVVDDETAVRAVSESFVRRLCGRTLSAADGPDAVRLFGLRHAEIDAVLVDYTMPGLDGLATIRRMRVIRPDVPVVLASGRNEPDVRRRVEELAGVVFLPKPFTLPDLSRALGEVLP